MEYRSNLFLDAVRGEALWECDDSVEDTEGGDNVAGE